MSKYVALLIDTINHDISISGLLDPQEKIKNLLEKHNTSRESRAGAQMKIEI